MPEFLRLKIISIIKKCFHKKEKTDKNRGFLKKYSIKNYYVSNDAKNSLDLLAICKK